MGNTLQRLGLPEGWKEGEQYRKYCIARIASPVKMYRNGLTMKKLEEEVEYEMLVKAKLQTKKAVIPFSYPESIVNSVIKSENPIFIKGRLCEVRTLETKKADYSPGYRRFYRLMFLEEVPLFPKKCNLIQEKINKKQRLRRKYPLSGQIICEGMYPHGCIYNVNQVAITNKGNEDYLLMYQYFNYHNPMSDNSYRQYMKSGSLIEPTKRKTVLKIPKEALRVPEEHYTIPLAMGWTRLNFYPVIKFESYQDSNGQKRVYLCQFYSNLKIYYPYEYNLMHPKLSEGENRFQQLKRILEQGIGRVGDYYDLLTRKNVEGGIVIQKRLELPEKVDMDGFIDSLIHASEVDENGRNEPRFFCHKSYHLRIPHTSLYVYLDPISGKFVGIKKELFLGDVKELEKGSNIEQIGNVDGELEGGEVGFAGAGSGIPSKESILFEVELSKTDLKRLKTIDFNFGGNGYKIINVKDCMVRGDLIDLKATDMNRQAKLVEWMEEILGLYQKKFPKKTTNFFRNIDKILSCDYVYYFRIDTGTKSEYKIPICYLIFVKSFKNCEFEVLDLTAVIGGK